jgi:hypothetical protein
LDMDPGRSKAKNGNFSKSFDSMADSSDLELPDIGALPSTKDSKKPKNSQSALAKYNAEKEKEKKAQGKEQQKKNSAATKIAEKENKRLAREEKVLEKERAQAMAKVNVLKTDKKELVFSWITWKLNTKSGIPTCQLSNGGGRFLLHTTTNWDCTNLSLHISRRRNMPCTS